MHKSMFLSLFTEGIETTEATTTVTVPTPIPALVIPSNVPGSGCTPSHPIKQTKWIRIYMYVCILGLRIASLMLHRLF